MRNAMNRMQAQKSRLKISHRRQVRGDERSGAVAVEMAICLPLLFFIFLGSIDLIRYNLLKNVVTQATYEAARAGIVRGATRADVESVVEEEISRFAGNLDYTLTTVPDVFPTTGSGTLKVTLNCNIREAGWIVSSFITGDVMEETIEIEF